MSIATAMVACSPALNWRSVLPAGAALEATLPCKPQSATRPMQWKGQALPLVVTGCQMQGVLFAVSHLELSDASQADAVLARWQQTVRESVRGVDEARVTPFIPPLALASPGSVRMTLHGVGASGAPVEAQAVWFARGEGDGHARLYHALVTGPSVDADATDTLFAGLRLLQ